MPRESGGYILYSYAELYDEAKKLPRKIAESMGIYFTELDPLFNKQPDLFANTYVACTSSVSFSTTSIGNCGTMCITNISFGNLLSSRCVNEGGKVISYPKEWQNSFGGVANSLLYLANSVNTTTNKPLADKDIEPLIKTFLSKISAYNSIVVSDSVNRASGYRYGGENPPLRNDTATFMAYLEKSKIGYLVKSPISLNPAHNSGADLSIIRHWIYYPPGSVVCKAGKFLGSGEPIPEDPQEIVDNLSKYRLANNAIKAGSYSADFFVNAFRNWSKGSPLEKVDKRKKV